MQLWISEKHNLRRLFENLRCFLLRCWQLIQVHCIINSYRSLSCNYCQHGICFMGHKGRRDKISGKHAQRRRQQKSKSIKRKKTSRWTATTLRWCNGTHSVERHQIGKSKTVKLLLWVIDDGKLVMTLHNIVKEKLVKHSFEF